MNTKFLFTFFLIVTLTVLSYGYSVGEQISAEKTKDGKYNWNGREYDSLDNLKTAIQAETGFNPTSSALIRDENGSEKARFTLAR